MFEVNQLINVMFLLFTKHLEFSEEENVISSIYAIHIQNCLVQRDQMQIITHLTSIKITGLREK